MSWRDDLSTIPFEIVTGDSKVWRPLLSQSYEKNIEYSGVQYEFINRVGSLFARRLPKGRTYPLEFSFTGGDNVKVANAFELSARDYRAWRVTHPFYGRMQVQPLSMKMVSNGLNSTAISCQVVESVDAKQPLAYPDYKDAIEQKLELLQTIIYEFGNIEPLSANELQVMTNTVSKLGKMVERIVKLESEYKQYREALNKALNEIDNAMAMTVGFIKAAQQLINLPASIASDIGTRFNMLKEALNSLKDNIEGIISGAYFKKLFYNLIGATVVSAMAKAVITQNSGDFETKADVEAYVNKLLAEYDDFLETLYGLEDEDFIPDHDVVLALHTLMCETVGSLYQVMFEAKQERVIYTERETNIIILAHRLYGLASDENIAKIKNTNKIGLSEILNIKKDRPIKYYV